MIIEFSWGTGKMAVDPDLLILEMPLTNYRKWLKLFIRYGKREDHIQMIQCLCRQLVSTYKTIKDLEAEFDQRAVRDRLRAAKRQHKRIIKMWDALGGRLS